MQQLSGTKKNKKYIYNKRRLDCDPGHDDALAIVLALHSRSIKLLGISTVAGNQSIDKTTLNAARMVAICDSDVKVHKGCGTHLIRKARHDPEIHGESGLEIQGGSQELESFPLKAGTISSKKAVLAMADMLLKQADKSVSLVVTGSQTNVAILLKLFPEVKQKLKNIVFMGGAIGVGNRSPVAEFNILLDPEAAKIVVDSGLEVVMVPLEVTHKVLATRTVLDSILTLRSPFAKMMYGLLTFFGATYEKVFGFKDGPPLHDPCCIAYLIDPTIFRVKRMRVDVVTGAHMCAGQTVCDVWHDSPLPKNVSVCVGVNPDAFWRLMLNAIRDCDRITPYNRRPHL